MADDLIPEALLPFPVHTPLNVIWGDMDAMQHVNNTVYFRYTETARFDYFEKIGWNGVGEGGIGPILHSISCRFKFPLTYPDKIWVGSKVTQIGSDRFTMRHRIYSVQHKRVAAELEGILVAFDYRANSKCDLPQTVRQHIEDIERAVPSLEE